MTPLVLFAALLFQSPTSPSRPELLIRIDDIGMNHSVNLALAQLADTKIPLSASVMFACPWYRSEEHTSELQSHSDLVCRLLLEKKKKKKKTKHYDSSYDIQ